MAINRSNRGFALLIAVVFMSVMLAFGLALGSLSYKQQVLATAATGSQHAFYAADAGLECALYADQKQNLFAFPQSDPASAPAATCESLAPVSTSKSWSASKWVVTNRFSLESGTRCADIVAYKTITGGVTNTYIFSQGYNVPCTTVASPQVGARILSRGVNIQYSGATQAATSSASIAYVQSTSSTTPSASTVTVKYAAAQAAGDLNVVIIGWEDSGSQAPTSVTDSKGNVYTLAVGPLRYGGFAAQSIYYAKNIAAAAAGSNTVTVAFGTTISYPDLRVAEYSGIDTSNPFERGTGATSASGTALNSGSITTTNANDLLVAGDYLAANTTGPGSGFTQRVMSGYSELLEDMIVSTTGSYAGTATSNSSNWWMIQIAAFKAAP